MPNHVAWPAVNFRSTGFCRIALTEASTAASKHNSTPATSAVERCPEPKAIIATPQNATPLPIRSHRGEALFEEDTGKDSDEDGRDVDQHGAGAGVEHVLRGVQRHVIAAEPHHPVCHDRQPLAAARPDLQRRQHHDSKHDGATANRPSVREPGGEKLGGPTARMPTKAEAHRTTVMMTAAMPSLLMAAPGAGGVVRGGGRPGGKAGRVRPGVVVVMSQIYPSGAGRGWRFSDASGQDPANVRLAPLMGPLRP